MYYYRWLLCADSDHYIGKDWGILNRHHDIEKNTANSAFTSVCMYMPMQGGVAPSLPQYIWDPLYVYMWCQVLWEGGVTWNQASSQDGGCCGAMNNMHALKQPECELLESRLFVYSHISYMYCTMQCSTVKVKKSMIVHWRVDVTACQSRHFTNQDTFPSTCLFTFQPLRSGRLINQDTFPLLFIYGFLRWHV